MSYCRIARFYRLLECATIGRSLLDARLAHLDLLGMGAPIKNALFVGEGNGSFLVPFAERFPLTKITVVDASSEMLRVARQRLAECDTEMSRVDFLCLDLTKEPMPEGCYDLVVTLFFFDNFDELMVRKLMISIESICNQSAQWLLSDFQIPAKGWRRLRAQIWLKLLYASFRAVTSIPAKSLPRTEEMLETTSFNAFARKTCCGEMLFSTLYRN